MKSKKLLLSGLTLTLMFQTPIIASAHAQGVSPVIELEKYDSEVEDQAVGKVVRSVGVKALYQIVNKATGRITSKSPSISLGNSRDTASSGTIHYNQGSHNAASVRKNVQAVKKGHEIEMWGNSHQIGWTGKIAVTLSRPDSSKDAINRSVGHNQYSWFKVVKPGNHIARWTTSNKQSWTLWQGYYHWGDLHKKCDSKGNCMLPSSKIEDSRNSVNFEKDVTAVNPDGKVVNFEAIEEFRYLKPSKEHLQLNATAKMENNKFKKKIYNMNNLYSEYYDNVLEEKVDVAKTLVAGDNVYLSDTINNIEYDSDENVTIFEFTTNYGPQYLAFKEDLTSEYNVGDSLNFNFKIVNLHHGHAYTNLDYSVITQNGVYPDIKEFLVSKLSKEK